MEISDQKFRSQVKSASTAIRAVLTAVFEEGRPADRALGGFMREHKELGSRDRQFISECLYSMLRYWGILRRFLPVDRREEIEGGHIRLARVELDAMIFAAFYLDGSNLETADRLARQLEIPWPKSNRNQGNTIYGRAEALGERFGVAMEFKPEHLVPDWLRGALPPEFPFDEWLRDLERRPPMWLRMQCSDPDRLIAELRAAGLDVERHPHIADALRVENPRVNLYTLDAYRRGEFEVQDLASQCIGLAASPQAGERWFDACAGAGGKSLQLASLMNRKGTVVASDIRAYKLEDLRTRSRRAGFPNIMTREWNGKPIKGNNFGAFDGVLVDAPCSCSGVWRRNPDGRWTVKPEEIAEMAALQSRILENAESAVKPGGVLIYATCSLFPAENGGVAGSFLETHPEYTLEPFPHPLTGEPCSGMLQLYSFDGDCDSMFVARMRREA